MPGRCAAPPAPAMITSMPRVLGRGRVFRHQPRRAVRGDDFRSRAATPKLSSISAAWRMVSQSDLLPMMTTDQRLRRPSDRYCPCASVNPGLPSKLRRFRSWRYRGRGRSRDPASATICFVRDGDPPSEAAAETIGAEGFRRAVGPHLDAAVGDHLQLQTVAGSLADGRGEVVGLSRRPLDVDVDADQFLLGWDGRPRSDCLRRGVGRRSRPPSASPASGPGARPPRRRIPWCPTFCLLTPSVKMS